MRKLFETSEINGMKLSNRFVRSATWEASAFKKAIDVPLILVGGNRSFQVAERLVNEGAADYVSMNRPLIREPDLINRWKSGDLKKAACVSDNMCFKPAMKGDGIYCVTEERQKK